jgi:hypothetical protein
MKFRTVIECAVIMAAASVAVAGDYWQRVEQAQQEAQHAECEAQALPVLTPWPMYEQFRLIALADANDAKIDADRASMYASCADTAWKSYSYQMVLKATKQAYSQNVMTQAKATYDDYVAKTLSLCDESESESRMSLQQTTFCRLLLAE